MPAPVPNVPAGFARGCAVLRSWVPRPDVVLAEVAPPTRVAPHALALVAELIPPRGGDADPDSEPPATGRFVVLHDPAGQEGWDGDTRVVAFVRADLDDDMTRDPLLSEVVWSWLVDALAEHGAAANAASGTVSTTVSRRFGSDVGAGALGAEAGSEVGEVELRCSWTPAEPTDLGAHLAAFCDVLALAAGVPPLTPGVTPLHPR